MAIELTEPVHVRSRIPVTTLTFPPADRATVLIVDDENGPRQALRMLLKDLYDTYVAVDVSSAMEILCKQPINVVISDIRMPRKSGLDLLNHVRNDYPGVEVILLTGYGHLDTAMEAVNLGAFAYLEKPFDNQDMLDHVSHALAKAKETQEQRKLAALALNANRFELLGRIVSGLFHDMATPLSVVGTHLELLLSDKDVPQSLHDRLQIVLSQVGLCSDMVRSALMFMRDKVNHDSRMDLSDVAHTCLQLSAPLLRKQAVTVSKEFDPRPLWLTGDFVLIRQAVLNLINNACHAMQGQKEPAVLSVRTWRTDESAWLAIEDTGPGIAPEARSRLFDPFFTTKGDQGTGLGLAAVQNIMHRHNGEALLGESEGRGARFLLRFPPQKSSV